MPQIAAKENRVQKPTAHIDECYHRNWLLPHFRNAEVGYDRSIKPSPPR